MRFLVQAAHLAISLLFILPNTAALAQLGAFGAGGGHVSAELISPVKTVVPGSEWIVGLKLEHEEGWHTYWKYPGEAGLPTTIDWSLPEGFSAGAIEWPVPRRFEAAGMLAYGYEDEVVLINRLQVPDDLSLGETIEISAKVDWLECDPATCIPGGEQVSLSIQTAESSEPSEHADLIETFLEKIPQPLERTNLVSMQSTVTERPVQKDDPFKVMFQISVDRASIQNAKDLQVYPDPGANLSLSAQPSVTFSDGKASSTFRGKLSSPPENMPPEIGGVIKLSVDGESAPRAFSFKIPLVAEAVQTETVSPPPAPISLLSFLSMFGLAFIGGLILNIMPCVLPVISIKVFSFVKQAHESRGRIFLLGLAYCVGVLASFWLLAAVMIGIKAAGNSANWGALFQFPLFVIGVTAVVFVFGLNLLGVFEIQAPSGAAVRGLSELEHKEGPVGAFFTGVLATILATPCSAPFLGTAVAFALAQPSLVIFGIFTGIGFGLAFPFLLLSAFPNWTKYIPKPGNWMVVFKQAMGFLLLGTAVWLLWIVGAQLGAEGLIWTLCFLLALGISCWMIGAFIDYGSSAVRKFSVWAIALLIAVVSYAGFVHPVLNPPPAEPGQSQWISYSPGTLQKYRNENRLIFLDFTAEWCLTCKANEKLILESKTVEEEFEKLNVVKMKADFTRQDPHIRDKIASFGRSGVPLYVIYPPNGDPPIVLPEVITKSMVIEKLNQAVSMEES